MKSMMSEYMKNLVHRLVATSSNIKVKILNELTKSVLLCTDNKVKNVLRSFYSEFVGIFFARNHFNFFFLNEY